MENNRNPLIVVDAGHGGYDNGANYEGRPEKDDNLRLSLAVRDALEAQGVRTLMTRDTDVFIPLSERAEIANRSGADLFISIHRNSYTQQTPSTNGVENFIYLTAPEETAGRAAKLVLDEVVNVGVQSNRGVKRGNYYVLRRTNMPAMLLEMGYIINDEDNRLFEENLEAYAQAIARGAMAYFGLTYRAPGTAVPPIGTVPPVAPVPPVGEAPSGYSGLVAKAQQALNDDFGAGLRADGLYGPRTKAAAVRALQTELNNAYKSGLTADGVFGPRTQAVLPSLGEGDRGNMVRVLQILLCLKGYDPGAVDGIYGGRTKTAVQLFQRDHFLVPDGAAGPLTFAMLLT